MANFDFLPQFSTNDIYRNEDVERCLTDDLDTIERDINALESSVGSLETSKADTSHTHSQSDITGLNAVLAGKAASNHTHQQADVTGLETALADKASSNHTHSYNDLSDKPTIPMIPSSLPANGGNADTVGGKSASDFAAADHAHIGYAADGHTHAIDAVVGLLDLLMTSDDGKVKQTITGDVLATIKGWGLGVKTAYSRGGATATNTPIDSESWRYLAHKTENLYGWVLAFGSSGSIYANYLDNGTWKGWKAIYDASPVPLWAKDNGTSGYYMTAGHTVTPSKKLSECRTGWMLIWSDYNTDDGTVGNYDFCASFIPKINPAGGKWTGQAWLFDIVDGVNTTAATDSRIAKWLYVYDDKLVGHAVNGQGGRNDVVLRAVIEF